MGPEETTNEGTFDLGLVEVGHDPEPAQRPRHALGRRGLVVLVAVVVGALVVNAVVQHGHSPKHPIAVGPRPVPGPVLPAPVVPQPTGLPMPAIYRSGELLRSAVIDLSQPGKTLFTVTPSHPGPDFAVRCPYGMTGSAQYEVRVNGHVVLGSGCSGPDPDNTLGRIDGAIDASALPASWKAIGVRLGTTATVVVTVTQAAFATAPAPLMTLGLYQGR